MNFMIGLPFIILLLLFPFMYKKISQILSGAKKVFSLIGTLMFGIAAIVAYIVPFFIKYIWHAISFGFQWI